MCFGSQYKDNFKNKWRGRGSDGRGQGAWTLWQLAWARARTAKIPPDTVPPRRVALDMTPCLTKAVALEFLPMGAQLLLKAALPLAGILATASGSVSITPWVNISVRRGPLSCVSASQWQRHRQVVAGFALWWRAGWQSRRKTHYTDPEWLVSISEVDALVRKGY